MIRRLTSWSKDVMSRRMKGLQADPQIKKTKAQSAESITQQSTHELCEASVGGMLDLNLANWISNKHSGHGGRSHGLSDANERD
ncbi:hypothetical protein L1987_22989 [Smallanthus sonchifolius]|uniref:Uncharacterized protein n=1 Tax=Smallanthus sonchifolius TaxID=185202 RepID=A0ACB9IFM7_9ASTR|nr:hypothetical protein L1987_22989 [Smallanthus sonchifolius]